MRNKKFLLFSALCFILLLAFDFYPQMSRAFNKVDVTLIRDSLDAIKLYVPKYHRYTSDKKIKVKNQSDWESVGREIQEALQTGYRSIYVNVVAKELVIGEGMLKLDRLNYPTANIRISANRTRLVPAGRLFSIIDDVAVVNNTHYALPYSEFDLNDVLLDEKNNPLSIYDEVFSIKSEIEEVEGKCDILKSDGCVYKTVTKIWRFKTELPDLSEKDCENFYILLTRCWTACRHKVQKVQDGYLYFYLVSDDAPTLMQKSLSPNSDQKEYRENPRCRYVNAPFSKGVHISNDSIYIPTHLNKIRLGKHAQLISVSSCHLNSLEISGFDICGSGGVSCIFVNASVFSDQMWISNNTFSNLNAAAVTILKGENICIDNNTISHTRIGGMNCFGKGITVSNNQLSNIGYMLQSMGIAFSGENMHVYGNTITDFNYSAIGCSDASANGYSTPRTYIIERNAIMQTKAFTQDYRKRILADGGGIYVGPQNTQGIIRYNIIDNIQGIRYNSGIYLDDGGKNLAIYGNLVTNTANCYDITLRWCETYKQGIPDHNTNNVVIQNIMTGCYQLEEGSDAGHCVAGNNVLLGYNSSMYGTKVKVVRRANDFEISGANFTNSKIIFPKKYKHVIDSLKVDSFIAKKIRYK